MTQYAILIYERAEWSAANPEAQGGLLEEYNAFGSKHESAIKGGSALLSAKLAKSVKKDPSGSVEVVDGPFAETKEILGGFYLIDVPDEQTALDIAAEIPLPAGGTIEVRPVAAFG